MSVSGRGCWRKAKSTGPRPRLYLIALSCRWAGGFGCGPLGVLDMLSRRVGPTGEVIGLDSEPRMIGFAQRSVAERGLDNVTLIRADARAAGLKADSFDLAHERLVLIMLTSPQAVVDEMVRVVRLVAGS
jgi:ubiquinone/menaquinone biosynthesis C-methylase UbiE